MVILMNHFDLKSDVICLKPFFYRSYGQIVASFHYKNMYIENITGTRSLLQMSMVNIKKDDLQYTHFCFSLLV